MSPTSSGRVRKRVGLFFACAALVAVFGAVAVSTGTSAATVSPAPAVKPAGHVHIHKYTPKNNPGAGSGWSHEGGHAWNYLVDGTNDYTTRNNDSEEVAQDDYRITETLTSQQQADGWQLLDIYVPDHGKGTPGGGNDQCERDGPRPEGQRQTAANVLAGYFTDQDHNNNGTVHVCAFNGQAPTTRILRAQKVTSATAHPGGAFSITIGQQSASLVLGPGAGASAVAVISGAPVDQSLPVSESFPTDPPGWSLIGFIVKPDPTGSATCSASEAGWQEAASVPTGPDRYLVCVKDSYAAITGTLRIQKDDRAEPSAPQASLVGGATFKLERIENGVPLETLCVTDDTTDDPSPATAVICGPGAYNRDDRDGGAGVTSLAGLTLGTWRVTEVGLPAGFGPDTCTGDRKGVRETVLSASGPDQGLSGPGCAPASAFHNPIRPVTVRAYKAICDSFANVPRNTENSASDHYGELATGPVDSTVPVAPGAPLPQGCRLATAAEPFGFRYNYDQDPVNHPNPMPFTGTGFGPTNAGGFAEVALDRSHFMGGHMVWIAEVPTADYAFAGLRCHRDAVHQDNAERIWLESGEEDLPTVYCIAYNVPTGSIAGEKYNDLDADGARDAGEPGLEGWTVTAIRMNGAPLAPFTTTTGSDGAFVFHDLPEGTYSVCETTQPGWTATQPTEPCYTRTLAPGAALSGLAFGNVRPGALTVVKVDLGLNGSWTFEAVGPTQTSPRTIVGNGATTFSNLKPGTYTVTEANGSAKACQPGESMPGEFETRHGSSGNPADSQLGRTFEGIHLAPGQSMTVYFVNRDCDVVLNAPNLYIQKLNDPEGNRTGTEPLAGFKFTVKRDGQPIAGSPFTSPESGLIILSGLDVGDYVVEEIAAPPHLHTGSKTDLGDDGTFESSVPGQPPAIDLHLGSVARVNFYNQTRSTIRVHKEEADHGSRRPGGDWEFTLSGCGVRTTAKTDSAGDIEWRVPYRANCAYQVEESGRPGWIAAPSAVQEARPGAGESVTLTFLNSREVVLFNPTEKPTCTPVPTSTPEGPGETPGALPTATPTPVAAVGGERTPGAPKTGCGTGVAEDSSQKGTLFSALGLLALVVAGGGLAFYIHSVHRHEDAPLA